MLGLIYNYELQFTLYIRLAINLSLQGVPSVRFNTVMWLLLDYCYAWHKFLHSPPFVRLGKVPRTKLPFHNIIPLTLFCCFNKFCFYVNVGLISFIWWGNTASRTWYVTWNFSDSTDLMWLFGPQITELCLEFICYDPNYNYGSDDEDEFMETDLEDDEEEWVMGNPGFHDVSKFYWRESGIWLLHHRH